MYEAVFLAALAISELAVYQGKMEIVKMLLESGADVNAKSNDGNTPLVVAQTFKQDSIASFLKEHGGV